MNSEKPIINKCCGIIPNSVCLVVFALLKIIADIFAVCIFGWYTINMLYYDNYTENVTVFSALLLIDLGLILDIAFMIIKIVGACTKCNHLFKVSFVYDIISLLTALAASVTFVLIFIIGSDYMNTEDTYFTSYIVITIAIIIAYILIHILVILLEKSEITKKANEHGDRVNADDRIKRTSQLSYGRFV